MSTRTVVALAGALVTVCTPVRAFAQTLGLGDPAPKLQVKQWVKGQPVPAFQKGKLYVVEFWATWCGPCRTSIPHLTELQKKYPQTTFIGVSILEEDQKAVKPFVAQMGAKMAYRVALDAVPAGQDGSTGKMAKTWMEAAGQEGIPTAFIVNKEGKIAWIGHPMQLDEPLGKVVAGKWDLAKLAAEQKVQAIQRQKLLALQKKVQAAGPKDPAKIVEVLDQAFAEDASLEPLVAPFKFQVLKQGVKDEARATAYGDRLVATVLKDNAEALNAIAWMIVSPEAPKASPAYVQLALKAALRADEVSKGKDAGIVDTLAKAYFDSGDTAKAVETQQRALDLSKGLPQQFVTEMRGRLEEYRKASEKAPEK